jgi:prepilin-type N-terminal cleavage/methylation domain-containing protein
MVKGFTFIEVLIAIGIIALLSVIVFLIINPTELLKQSRDSGRISSLNTLKVALELARSSQLPLGSANILYISIPDPAATSTAGDQCQGLGLPVLPSGWAYHCAASSTYLKVDGTGWLPVNFAAIPGGGSPLNPLLVDPVNASSSDLYYTYGVVGNDWELTAVLESNKDASFAVGDGGIDPAKYEVGTFGITPFTHAFAGFWPFDEGSGAATADLSGYGAMGAVANPAWTAGKIGNALDFSSGVSSLDFGFQLQTYLSNNIITVTSWIYPTTGSSYGLNPGQWYFIAGVYNLSAQTVDFYVNGRFDGEFLGVSTQFPWTSSVFSPTAQNPPLIGIFDQLMLYNRPLTAAQIQAIYNAIQ